MSPAVSASSCYWTINVSTHICRKQVAQTASDAEKDGVVVPRTLEEYCIKPKSRESEDSDLNDFYYEEDYLDDEDDEDNYDYESDGEDSGNEES